MPMRSRTRRARALELLADGPQIDAKVIVDKLDQVSVWKVRESAVGDSRAPGYMDAEGNWEDAAVHPDKLGAYLRDFQQILDDHGYRCVYYGHFGQGCVHTRMDFDLKSAQGVKTFRSFMEKCADLVVAYGGSLAGEYGEGHGRAELLPKMFGPELMEAFNDFKRIWDPDWKMNPNRLIGDVKLDEGLRLGPDYRPPELKTHFAYPDDGGSFATAIERCFGMAKCRNLGSLTMCPSFHATREERHSTRGRSRLLFEMLKGDPVTDGWRDDAVKESLDLCLSCKGCTGDCPVQVDIPTYKAEFLAHYYAKRRRPLHHYALGLMPWWGQVAARAPRLGQRAQPFRAGRRACEADNRHGRGARDPEVRPPDIPQLVRGPERRDRRQPHPPRTTAGAASCCGPTRSRTCSSPTSARPRSTCSRPPGSRSRSRRSTCAADGRCTTSGCSASPNAPSSTRSKRCPSRSSQACRCSCSSRAAPRCSATSCAS